jgi:hypothetical protein
MNAVVCGAIAHLGVEYTYSGGCRVCCHESGTLEVGTCPLIYEVVCHV